MKLINDRAIGGQFETPEYESEEYDDEMGSASGPIGINKNGSVEFVEIEMVSRV